MNGDFFYILINGKIQGPFPKAKLRALYNSAAISSTTQVSSNKLNWQTLQEILQPAAEKPVMENNFPKQKMILKAIPVKKVLQADQDCQIYNEPDKDEGTPLNKSGEAYSGGESAGDTLSLMWNAPEKLQKLDSLPMEAICRVVFPISFIFPVLLAAATAASVAFFFGAVMNRILFQLGLFFTIICLTWITLCCFKNKNPDREKHLRHSILLSGMLWMNFGMLSCIATLTWAMTELPAPGALPQWPIQIASVFTIGCFCFCFANICTGLQTGLNSFYFLRTRAVPWCSALFFGEFIGLLAAAKKLIFLLIK